MSLITAWKHDNQWCEVNFHLAQHLHVQKIKIASKWKIIPRKLIIKKMRFWTFFLMYDTLFRVFYFPTKYLTKYWCLRSRYKMLSWNSWQKKISVFLRFSVEINFSHEKRRLVPCVRPTFAQHLVCLSYLSNICSRF